MRGEVETAIGQEVTVALRFGQRIRGTPVHQLDPTRIDSREDVPIEPFAERARVAQRQPDVFVEMKRLDPGPVDPVGLGQLVEELELGGGGGEDRADPGPALEQRPQAARHVVGRGPADGLPVGQPDDPQPIALELAHACSGMKTTKKT